MSGWIKQHRFPLLAWLLVSLALTSYLLGILVYSEDKRALLPGVTTSGHHQIELSCDSCHTEEPTFGSFTASGVTNKSCLACHREDMQIANDSHPAQKFRSPDNAVLLEHIDAAKCITCHIEHREERTGTMAVTVPGDYCAHCHQITLDNRPSHQNLPFDSCATAGCHNFHDNTSLSDIFLLRHADAPDFLGEMAVPPSTLHERNAGTHPPATEPDAAGSPEIIAGWAATAHAGAGVNCTDCHGAGAAWSDRLTHESCASCHGTESADFLRGKHGMRLAVGLSPMTPGLARQPMHAEAGHRELSCSSCHAPHSFDRALAPAAARMQHHADAHPNNYATSGHHRAWLAEQAGTATAGSGVSCATCHMPREERSASEYSAEATLVVQHNQSMNLRPNEKMLRDVCIRCHGLGFAMDALADPPTILSNFSRPPETHVESIDWVLREQETKETKTETPK